MENEIQTRIKIKMLFRSRLAPSRKIHQEFWRNYHNNVTIKMPEPESVDPGMTISGLVCDLAVAISKFFGEDVTCTYYDVEDVDFEGDNWDRMGTITAIFDLVGFIDFTKVRKYAISENVYRFDSSLFKPLDILLGEFVTLIALSQIAEEEWDSYPTQYC